MGREQMFAAGDGREDGSVLGRIFGFGGMRPAAAEPTPEPEPPRHGFDQVSKVARADPELSHRAFRILAALEGYCFGDDRESWVTNRTLGKQAGGIGLNAVRLGLRELEKRGYIRIDPDPTKMRGQRIAILYRLKRPDRPPLEEDDR